MSRPLARPGIEDLQGLEPISSLAPEQLDELRSQSQVELFGPGAELTRAGAGRHAIYLLRGEAEVRSGDGASRVVRAGSAEALHPLTDDGTGRTDVVACSEVAVLRVDTELLDRLLTWAQISAPEEAVVMSEGRIITVNKADWLKTMFRSQTFRSLPPANIEELLHRLEPIFAGAGQVIIRQGDQGDYFYMIDKGIVLVTHNPDNDEDCIEMAELNEGDTFGEAALLSDNPRNATVSMMTDGILLRLSKENFNKLLRQPTLQWLELAEAQRRVAAGGKWIDVRLPSEFEHSHLEGAINIPMSALHRTARELDRGVAYVCYCQTGRRSSAAAFVLRHYGLDAAVLSNGLQQVPESLLSRG